ncbi:Thiol-disulfide isomerase or thioredoxin [Flaviramulus basaltis]|uniref:Thiol-disulfide isomerase or thioredoxin n=1 Tax=Flaviramulus basaltis TaxID=369401 RepID=A0A1K2IN35_9FLAO|nr:TlpA disulfide reductase family protein [Flaviramulus basaltis]SFZ93083.1 Thiol-disulfide isomerase or thioredoxin [Flaviramulus basaltis]
MKYILKILALSFLAFISCKNELVDYALISGHITNKTEDFKILSLDRKVSQTLNIKEDGTFLDTLRLNKGTYVLYDGTSRASIYIENGSHIIINADASNFTKSLAFSGQGYDESEYLLEKGKIETDLIGEKKTFYLLDELAFKTKAKEIETTLINVLDAFVDIPEDFKTAEKKDLNYSYLSKLNSYEPSHAYYAEKTEFKSSKEFLADLNTFVFDNREDYLLSPEYKKMVNSHYMNKVGEMIQKDSISADMAILEVSKRIPNEIIRNNFLFDNSKIFITISNDVEKFYNTFLEISTNKEHIEELAKTYKMLSLVANGQHSPKFVNYENHAGGSTSLDDLKGKYVYIDVWATWCGPCKYEIPFLKKIEKQFHDKNIVFVSLSVDKKKDYEKWKKMVIDKELTGIQLLADKDFESDFIKDYMVKGIPKFILLDPDGKIVRSSAPRPSSKDLIDLFNELNI